ncbi:MAG: hypothetical protein ABJA98_14290 [Acidobacteriota bacterium]
MQGCSTYNATAPWPAGTSLRQVATQELAMIHLPSFNIADLFSGVSESQQVIDVFSFIGLAGLVVGAVGLALFLALAAV